MDGPGVVQLGDASIAAPFTSRKPTPSAVLHVIRQVSLSLCHRNNHITLLVKVLAISLNCYKLYSTLVDF